MYKRQIARRGAVLSLFLDVALESEIFFTQRVRPGETYFMPIQVLQRDSDASNANGFDVARGAKVKEPLDARRGVKPQVTELNLRTEAYDNVFNLAWARTGGGTLTCVEINH